MRSGHRTRAAGRCKNPRGRALAARQRDAPRARCPSAPGRSRPHPSYSDSCVRRPGAGLNSVLIGVYATSVERMCDREPCCRAGRKSPVHCRVSMRDRSALLYAKAVCGTALFLRWGLPVRAWNVAGDRLQRPLRSRFQPRLMRSVRRLPMRMLPDGCNVEKDPGKVPHRIIRRYEVCSSSKRE